ncbi:DUF2306 domain-containing protein [Paenibacillus hamazuiensis]|uniref:DUF2306 domain-containing protein n=1 Tax=Paenibacillus hamazuiensis TaxID=2936508 RepID=UPI00200FFB25|nr:DUF2306 domain-containing protein [Paenibacillus hamazuiensis]
MKLRKSWWVLAIVSIGVMIPFMAPYVTLDPAKSRIEITSSAVQYPLLVAHIAFAFVALVSGLLQFIDRIRVRNPETHRNVGKVYVYSVFVSGLLAIGTIFYIENYTKAIAFLVLALAWLFTGWKGYVAARKRNFEEHRRWMIRSFGMTLVAVSARLLVPVLMLLYYVLHGFALPGGREAMVNEILNVNMWVGLVLDLMIVEWVMLKSAIKPAQVP